MLDLIVFGRAAGKHIEEMLQQGLEQRQASDSDIDFAMSRLARLNESKQGESVPVLRAELQKTMQNHFGVFRKGEFMQEGIKKLNDLRERLNNAD